LPGAAAQLGQHHFHGCHAKAELRLADRSQRHPEMFTHQHIAEAGERDVLWDAHALLEEHVGRANRHQIVDGLHGGRASGFLQELQGCLLALLDGGTSGEDQAVVEFHPCLAERLLVAGEPVLRPSGDLRPGKEGDASVAEFQQMPRDAGGGCGIIIFHCQKAGAELRPAAEDHDGRGSPLEFLVNRGRAFHSCGR